MEERNHSENLCLATSLRLVKASFFGLCLLFILPTANVEAASTKSLPSNQWAMISLPADPGPSATVRTVLADDFPAGSYGTSGQWILYSLDANAGVYEELTLDSVLEPAQGYWIYHITGSTVVLDLPSGASEFTGSTGVACPSPEGCISTPLNSSSAPAWHLLGRAGDSILAFSGTRISGNSEPCIVGCTPLRASYVNALQPQLYTYDPATNSYIVIVDSSPLEPWAGYWLQTLQGANGRDAQWLQPIYSPGTTTATPAQRDAARLLTQATFGTNEQQISSVTQLGGPSEWIDNQIALQPSLHLPIVNARFPEGFDGQIGRYHAFWEHALRADDQLRQRVAFALSEIMVVSENPDPLFSHGQSLAAYYDRLIVHAFGNFRDLMESVALSPTMGVYLSMLGNSKPDPATGRRADENFARELMQLFTIGLVQLNQDGTPVTGEPVTYTQPDVENLARIFTGWAWDVPEFDANPFSGWYPDRGAMERPMRAFPEHHDMDSKVFLGQDFPADQSAEQDMDQALDILFQHPNVGPFISRQLIQRLVTSNPTPAYVQRVARVFNNNGQGERGDLGAVIKAILLDSEARDETVAQRSDFGKLREPILRLSHLWRAFPMRDELDMEYARAMLTQHAPLSARSVFNFFSPSFSPPGPIRDAGLLAPEYQINSETEINGVNTTLMILIQQEQLYEFFQARLSLDTERSLLDSPPELINRLDLLLFSGGMSAELRQLLLRYMAENDDPEQITRERLLRDVISLAFLSADYTVQR
ncbi:MAG: DUF1800 family protein [Granulosicoccus sp.]